MAPRSTAHMPASHPLADLRASDPDRFLQVLFAPSAARRGLLALFRMNLELARVADHVREPMAGLIRLQWWRDAIGALAAGSTANHPVVEAVGEAGLVDRLGAERLLALIDAREIEVDATPMKRLSDVEAHARATAGALNALVARLLTPDPSPSVEFARAAGTAYGLLGIVRAVPFVLGRAQPLLPEEPLAAQGLEAGGLQGTAPSLDALRPVLAEMTTRAGAILDTVPPRQGRRLAAAFVPALLARQDLARLRARDLDVFDGRLAERPPWTTARCLLAASVGRY